MIFETELDTAHVVMLLEAGFSAEAIADMTYFA